MHRVLGLLWRRRYEFLMCRWSTFQEGFRDQSINLILLTCVRVLRQSSFLASLAPLAVSLCLRVVSLCLRVVSLRLRVVRLGLRVHANSLRLRQASISFLNVCKYVFVYLRGLVVNHGLTLLRFHHRLFDCRSDRNRLLINSGYLWSTLWNCCRQQPRLFYFDRIGVKRHRFEWNFTRLFLLVREPVVSEAYIFNHLPHNVRVLVLV